MAEETKKHRAARWPLMTMAAGLISLLPTTYGANLLVNGDAEVGSCTQDWQAVTTVPGWRVTRGSPSLVCYSIAGFTTPTAADKGQAFLADGPYGDSTLVQDVALASAASAIDGGGVGFTLSGWLGGWKRASGTAQVSVDFFDAKGRVLVGGSQISGDTPAGRDYVSGFTARSTSGLVPAGARSAEVTVNFNQTLGVSNVGYADNLSLTLSTPVTPARLAAPPSTVPPFDHVFLVMMENTSRNQVIGDRAHAPFINQLASQGMLLTNYSATYHPSDENYLAIAGGDAFVQGAVYFPQIKLKARHLGDQVEAVGKSWRAYEQGMGTPCNLKNNFDAYYEPDDAPFVNFTSIAANPQRCQAHLFDTHQLTADLARAETTPNFAWIAADDYYDGEASGNGSARSLQTQNDWLQQTLQPIFNSPAWTRQRSLLILTWDESSGSWSDNQVATILVASQGLIAPGTSATHFDHYSTARTIESALGLSPMTANDQYARPVNEAFDGH